MSRRSSDRPAAIAERVERIMALVALVVIAAMAVGLAVERQQRAAADQRAEVVECVVRQVLAYGRERAREAGELSPGLAAAYTAALAPLREDCPPLVMPVPPAPAGEPRP